MARSFRGLWTRLIFVFALAATALAQSPVSDDTFVTRFLTTKSTEEGRGISNFELASAAGHVSALVLLLQLTSPRRRLGPYGPQRSLLQNPFH